MGNDRDKDEISGVETTGHEWDGIKELNNPSPRWWLWVFIVTVIWSVGYWVVYPAWPTLTGHTKGVLGWTEYTKLKADQKEIDALRGTMAENIRTLSLADIQNDPRLYEFAVAAGRTKFKENCAACHGTGAEGRPGFPNLNDDDWLWGGKPAEIEQTLRYGIRSGQENMRDSQMPAFGEILKPEDVSSVAEHVLSLSGKGAANDAGAKIFAENCAACHGPMGKGGREFGAPNLSDALWLYGGSKADIVNQVRSPRHGVMPAWGDRLSDETLKELTIYVHALGGGEK